VRLCWELDQHPAPLRHAIKSRGWNGNLEDHLAMVRKPPLEILIRIASNPAVAVGVNQRTLEYAFREVLGTTLASYLRLHRMNNAHQDLEVADPNSSTVTEIATKWGFLNPGRFSVAHRKL
jgi:AraC-like DNA-binding protein